MKMNKMLNYFSHTMVVAVMSTTLTGCQTNMQTFENHPINNSQLEKPNLVVTERIPIPTLPPAVDATFPLNTHSKIIEAYQKYSQHGVAEAISGDGFITYPFNQYSKPIVQCAPLHLCIVQLQQGEIINDIALGDSAHWQVGTALIGTESNGTYQVSVKPTLGEIATDMVITTNLRSYHLGLVSVPHETSHIVSFYYPAETLQEAIGKASRGFTAKNNEEGERNRQSLAPHGIAASQLNFNYRISGHKTTWKPLRAFDDSEKTYIQMPAMSAHTELPVLYIIRNHEKQLVNYRYREPYFILDSLFEKAYLIAGSGRKQTKVVIENEQLQKRYVEHQSPMRATI